MLKLLTIVIAGVLTVATLKRVFQEIEAKRARVMSRNPDPSRSVTRLRQDPRTGVYYPES
jgi:hypothetical protein